MTGNPSCHLLDILAEVPDPRHKKGKRHPLSSILALIVIGLLVNHKGYTSIATWARNRPELTKALGFTTPKTPCAATIHNLVKRLDVVRLEATLTKWVFSHLESYQVSETQDLQGVAIDGKELCGSKDPETGFRTHLLSAVSHEIGVVLAECAVDGKTNEIPVSNELLKAFDVVGKVVTTDALLTQKTLDRVDFSGLLCYTFQDPKELETMAQTTAEFLIEQGKAEGKQDAVLKLLQLQFQNVPETLSREIRNIDNLTRLDALLEQTMTAQSLEEIDTQFSLASPQND